MSESARSFEPAYSLEHGDVERDREAVLSVWRGSLGKTSELDSKYDWFYRQSPHGAPLFMLLRHAPSDAVVGVAATGPRAMVWRGRIVRASVLADLAVLPQHRSLGPALSLEKALARAAASRFDVIYGFPNPKALPVFRRAGFALLGFLERHACVLRSADYLARHLPRVAALPIGAAWDASRSARRSLGALRHRPLRSFWSDRADPRMDALWARADRGDCLSTVRNAAFFRWRFDEMPGLRVRYLLVREAPDEELTAWFACARRGEHLHVLDAWSADGVAGMSRELVDILSTEARREGCVSVTVELSGSPSQLQGWKEAGFVPRERRPIVGLVSKRLGAPAPSLFLTSADEDE